MQQRDELISNLEEVKINLKNSRILNTLKGEQSLVEALKVAIDKYLNPEYIFSKDDFYSKVNSKAKLLLDYTNNSSFESYLHQFINASNFIIENANSLIHITAKVNENATEISREEFYK